MSTSPNRVQISLDIPVELGGRRLDQAVSELVPEYSRSRLQDWIKAGDLLVDGQLRKSKDKLLGGEKISIDAELEPEGEWQAESGIDFELVFEDEHLLVINKPAGLVVHPAAGNRAGTLLNGLLARWPDLETVPRAGIVHRLDKDTTGLMVVAKTLPAQTSLVRQLQKRTVSRDYEAIAIGAMTGGGTVSEPIGRHPKSRTKMAVLRNGGKEAITHYRVLTRFSAHTHIRVSLETGRTHQIRVHLAHVGYPLVGDATYGGRFKTPKGASPELIDALKAFGRQALHAARLGLIHPASGEEMRWRAPLPDDFVGLLTALTADQVLRESEP